MVFPYLSQTPPDGRTDMSRREVIQVPVCCTGAHRALPRPAFFVVGPRRAVPPAFPGSGLFCYGPPSSAFQTPSGQNTSLVLSACCGEQRMHKQEEDRPLMPESGCMIHEPLGKDFLLFRSVNAKKTAGHFGLAAVCFRMRFDL